MSVQNKAAKKSNVTAVALPDTQGWFNIDVKAKGANKLRLGGIPLANELRDPSTAKSEAIAHQARIVKFIEFIRANPDVELDISYTWNDQKEEATAGLF